ncbi:MAG: GTP cyclohydrolase I FolE [Flavobacteriales bacterium]|nr:GTP cyclohydrolase I FolE [Flavobacteriales bacterium]
MIELKDIEAIGEDHVGTSAETPLRPDAFELPDSEKIAIIAGHFEKIMLTLGLDLKDDSLAGTPKRVAKMYVQEIFSGLDPKNKPAISLFKNAYDYDQMLIEKDIEVYSVCEHHFVPIIGRAHVAYFAKNDVIGLSKINRIVRHYSRRPGVQERLTVQIVEELKSVLGTDDVGCVIEAKHLCVNSRGVGDTHSSTITSRYGGKFNDPSVKMEFLKHIGMAPLSIGTKIDI